MGASFKDAIRQHLELKERNRGLEPTMPLVDYRREDGDDAEPGHGDLLAPDGPHGWPSAEGLGLAAPAELWTTPALLEVV
jgi:hypothetical protein